MRELTFDDAYALLQSTMPDAEFFGFEKHGDVDKYGLPTGFQAVTVTCYEPRLSNAFRKIGDWIFFIDNRFISDTVHKIAMVWIIHKGGMKYGEMELMRSLRYCFKRFYAECLVTIGKPPIGRALLLENIIFERGFINQLLEQTANVDDSEASRLNSTSYDVARYCTLISQRHEIGHYLLSIPGEDLLENAAKLLEGIIEPSIRFLVEEGNSFLAEEVFCDAFALNSIVKPEEDYLAAEAGYAYSVLHLDEVRSANFCYTIMMQLSRIWFRALQDARSGWDATEQSSQRPINPLLALDVQSRERFDIVSLMVNQYIRLKGGDIYGSGIGLYYNRRYDQVIVQAATNLDQLGEFDELSVVFEPEREIVRFLASTMWLSPRVSQFLVDVGRKRELEGWVALDQTSGKTDPKTEINSEAALDVKLDDSKIPPSANAFSLGMRAIYDNYTGIFDLIVSDISMHGKTQEGTLTLIQSHVENLYKQIDEFGEEEEIYNSGPLKKYAGKMRLDFKMKIQKKQIILLTLIRNSLSNEKKISFSVTITERLSCLEEFAIRNKGVKVASFASILIPELDIAG